MSPERRRRIRQFAVVLIVLTALGTGTVSVLNHWVAQRKDAHRIDQLRSCGVLLALNLRASDKDKVPPYPADMPRGTTSRDYLAYLEKEGFLRSSDFKGVFIYWESPFAQAPEESIPYTIFRVSRNDPDDTLLLLSKPNPLTKTVVAITKAGTARSYPQEEAIELLLRSLPPSALLAEPPRDRDLKPSGRNRP